MDVIEIDDFSCLCKKSVSESMLSLKYSRKVLLFVEYPDAILTR